MLSVQRLHFMGWVFRFSAEWGPGVAGDPAGIGNNVNYSRLIYEIFAMATAATFDVDPVAGTVHIQDLTIHDAELVVFLEEFEDDRLEDAVTECLAVGAKTLQLAETAKEMEYVKREFEGMQSEVEGGYVFQNWKYIEKDEGENEFKPSYQVIGFVESGEIEATGQWKID